MSPMTLIFHLIMIYLDLHRILDGVILLILFTARQLFPEMVNTLFIHWMITTGIIFHRILVILL